MAEARIDEMVTEITSKISQKITETEENFILETITPYCEQVTEKVIDKDSLKKALILYYSDRMTGNDYQKLASRTINKKLTDNELLHHALHGMVGEIGEIHSLFQKVYQGHSLEPAHLQKEVGDLLWFIAEFCTCNGWDMESVMKLNIDKLKARFPEGFEEERSLHRKEGDV